MKVPLTSLQEQLPFQSGEFDAVVATKVLCSVADPAAASLEQKYAAESDAEKRQLLIAQGKVEAANEIREAAAAAMAQVKAQIEQLQKQHEASVNLSQLLANARRQARNSQPGKARKLPRAGPEIGRPSGDRS